MKRVIYIFLLYRFLILFLLLSATLFTKGQVQVSVFAGPQATSAKYKVRGIEQPADFKYGFMGGVGLKAAFENNLYFSPAVYYTMKGYKVTLNDRTFPPGEEAINNNTTIHAIEIAPLFQYDLSKKDGHFFIRFGPTIDGVIMGRETFDTSNNGNIGTVERDMVFGFDKYGRLSASANIHLGYEVNRSFMIFLHYAHGIGSMNNADYGPKILHRVAGISFGWLFGRNLNMIDTRNRE